MSGLLDQYHGSTLKSHLNDQYEKKFGVGVIAITSLSKKSYYRIMEATCARQFDTEESRHNFRKEFVEWTCTNLNTTRVYLHINLRFECKSLETIQKEKDDAARQADLARRREEEKRERALRRQTRFDAIRKRRRVPKDDAKIELKLPSHEDAVRALWLSQMNARFDALSNAAPWQARHRTLIDKDKKAMQDTINYFCLPGGGGNASVANQFARNPDWDDLYSSLSWVIRRHPDYWKAREALDRHVSDDYTRSAVKVALQTYELCHTLTDVTEEHEALFLFADDLFDMEEESAEKE